MEDSDFLTYSLEWVSSHLGAQRRAMLLKGKRFKRNCVVVIAVEDEDSIYKCFVWFFSTPIDIPMAYGHT